MYVSMYLVTVYMTLDNVSFLYKKFAGHLLQLADIYFSLSPSIDTKPL